MDTRTNKGGGDADERSVRELSLALLDGSVGLLGVADLRKSMGRQ